MRAAGSARGQGSARAPAAPAPPRAPARPAAAAAPPAAPGARAGCRRPGRVGSACAAAGAAACRRLLGRRAGAVLPGSLPSPCSVTLPDTATTGWLIGSGQCALRTTCDNQTRAVLCLHQLHRLAANSSNFQHERFASKSFAPSAHLVFDLLLHAGDQVLLILQHLRRDLLVDIGLRRPHTAAEAGVAPIVSPKMGSVLHVRQ